MLMMSYQEPLNMTHHAQFHTHGGDKKINKIQMSQEKKGIFGFLKTQLTHHGTVFHSIQP